MRIISKFHDYYDYVQQHYQDDLVWVRNQSEIECDIFNGCALPQLNAFTLGVCGKYYYGVKVGSEVAFTIEKFNKLMEQTLSNKQFRFYMEGKRYYFDKPDAVKMASYFKGEREKWIRNKNGETMNTYDWREPIVLKKSLDWQNRKVVLNPRLNLWGFQSVMPAEELYQELFMWFGKRAAPEKPIPQPSDEVMAEIKGFNKWSFRKPPMKK